MKFDMHLYWKHVRCRDVFLTATVVRFDDDGRNAILRGTWAIQGHTGWRFIEEARIKITPKEYDNWKPYTPAGRFKP